jgi:hypothetical protein
MASLTEQTGPVLVYDFEEDASGDQIKDASTDTYTGTLHGNASYVFDADKGSKVLYLDGTSGTFASFPRGFFDGSTNLTISMDLKPVTSSGNFFTVAIGQDNNKYSLMKVTPDQIRTAITINTHIDEQNTRVDEAGVAPPNIWLNLTFVMTPTSMSIYKNGVKLATSESITVSVSDLGSYLLAYLGKSFYGGDRYYEGYFDNIKIYNRALSEAEITE